MEDITPHYAETLALWRQRFRANLDQVRGGGFSEEFIRTWEFYFCYCEGAFRERAIGDVQILLTKPGCRRAHLSDSSPSIIWRKDYRALTGSFDKLVSIEMIEAVGHQYFDTMNRTKVAF